MRFKHADIRLKAGPAEGLADGEFEAYASVFGNVDSYGDVVMPGAFTKSLEEWAASGNALPVLFGHNMADPEFNIGEVVEAVEDERGLKVRARLDLDTPKGAATYRLLKGKRISQMSFAYDVVDGAPGTKDGEDVFELRELRLYEVSVVPIGANQETEILAVKAAADLLAGGVKEGRVLAAKHIDSLRSAQAAISAVIAAADSSENDQMKANGPAEGKVEGAGRVKAEDPQTVPSARTLAWEPLAAEISASCV